MANGQKDWKGKGGTSGTESGVREIGEIPRASATEIQRKLLEAMPRRQNSEGRSQNPAAKATIGRLVARSVSARVGRSRRLVCCVP